MAQIHCPNCGAAIPAKNINIQNMMAVCEGCDSVFQFDNRVVSKVKQEQRKIKPRENFKVIEADKSLKISYLYRENLGSMEYLVLVLSTLGVLGFGKLTSEAMGDSLLLTLFLGGLTLLALYAVVTYLVDRVSITVDDDEIKFYESPIYSFSNRTFKRDEVERVYCTPADANELNSPSAYQRVTLVKSDGIEQNLINYVQRDIALYITQMVQEYLQNDAESAPFMAENIEDADSVILTDTKTDIVIDTEAKDAAITRLSLGDDGELVARG